MLSIELNLNHPVLLGPGSSYRCRMPGMNTNPKHTPITSLLAIRMPCEENAAGSWTTPVSLSSILPHLSALFFSPPLPLLLFFLASWGHNRVKIYFQFAAATPLSAYNATRVTQSGSSILLLGATSSLGR